LLGIAEEHTNPASPWYRMLPDGKSNMPFPFYLPNGLNSGVLLLHLARLRNVSFVDSMLAPVFHKYGKRLPMGDQDLLNIHLFDHRQHALELPCWWNYQSEMCKLNGHPVGIAHGNFFVFPMCCNFLRFSTFV
jgi:hypothetical protein